jgi:hypothetical protein
MHKMDFPALPEYQLQIPISGQGEITSEIA